MAFPSSKPTTTGLTPIRTDTFAPPYDQQYHHPLNHDENLYGYHRFTTSSWRKPKKDTPPEKIDPKTGLIKIPDHNARDVGLPRGSSLIAPADCRIIDFGKGEEKNGGWIRIEFYLADASGKPKKYFMQVAHVDDVQVKKGDVVPRGTILATAHHIPRVGQTMLCIRVYDEKKKPVDYLKLVGIRSLPHPSEKIAELESRKTIVN